MKEAEPTIAKKIGGSLDRLWASLARLRADPVRRPIDGFLYWLDRAALDAGMRPALSHYGGRWWP